MSILIFRTDRIGDVVLTLPLASALRRQYPGERVLFCAQRYAAAIPRLCPDVDEVVEIAERDVRNPFPLARLLRQRQVRLVLFAYPRPGLALAAALARVPLRVGTAYRWYAPLFTHRHHEHRRESVRHERDYNLSLLGALGSVPEDFPAPRLVLDAAQRTAGRRILEESGIAAGRVVLLHPGSGGSAKDWPMERMSALARDVMARHADVRVLFSASTEELPRVRALREGLDHRAHVLPRGLALTELAAVLAAVDCVVANSTGPLHMAAALGTPVLGLYPFQRECHPRRWGPLGTATRVLMPRPASDCAACAAGRCDEHDAMERISVDEALTALEELLQQPRTQER